MKLWNTNLEGIYLSSREEARALEPINLHEVRLHLEMEGIGDYLMYRMYTIAVLAAIFCHGPRSMQNISRRNRRARAREDRTIETFPREERLRQAELIPMIQY